MICSGLARGSILRGFSSPSRRDRMECSGSLTIMESRYKTGFWSLRGVGGGEGGGSVVLRRVHVWRCVTYTPGATTDWQANTDWKIRDRTRGVHEHNNLHVNVYDRLCICPVTMVSPLWENSKWRKPVVLRASGYGLVVSVVIVIFVLILALSRVGWWITAAPNLYASLENSPVLAQLS